MAVALLLVAGAALGAAAPRTARACSGGNDPTRAEVVIAGYGTSVAIEQVANPGAVYSPVSAAITFEVDRYLKGSGPRDIRAYVSFFAGPLPAGGAPDFASLVAQGGVQWGVSPSCEGLVADPRGTYWVVGFERVGERLMADGMLQFAVGSGPDDPEVLDAVRWVERELRRAGEGPAPAEAGQGATAPDSASRAPAPLAAVLATFGAVALGRYTTRDRAR